MKYHRLLHSSPLDSALLPVDHVCWGLGTASGSDASDGSEQSLAPQKSHAKTPTDRQRGTTWGQMILRLRSWCGNRKLMSLKFLKDENDSSLRQALNEEARQWSCQGWNIWAARMSFFVFFAEMQWTIFEGERSKQQSKRKSKDAVYSKGWSFWRDYQHDIVDSGVSSLGWLVFFFLQGTGRSTSDFVPHFLRSFPSRVNVVQAGSLSRHLNQVETNETGSFSWVWFETVMRRLRLEATCWVHTLWPFPKMVACTVRGPSGPTCVYAYHKSHRRSAATLRLGLWTCMWPWKYCECFGPKLFPKPHQADNPKPSSSWIPQGQHAYSGHQIPRDRCRPAGPIQGINLDISWTFLLYIILQYSSNGQIYIFPRERDLQKHWKTIKDIKASRLVKETTLRMIRTQYLVLSWIVCSWPFLQPSTLNLMHFLRGSSNALPQERWFLCRRKW